MNLSQLPPEEKLLLARLEDLCRIAGDGGRRKFSSFLNEREVLIAEEFLRQRGIGCCRLYGGYPDAVRRVLGAFPSYEEPDDGEFPVVAVNIHLPKGAEPSHRDVLGSLMSLRVKRESIGDILFADRRCDVFVLEPVSRLVLDELKKVGGTGVRCETGVPMNFMRTEEFKDIRGTVSSLRMDCLVSLLTGLAREKGAELIRRELVQNNHQVVNSISKEFLSGDVITIRGYGKYIVEDIGKPTKKDRLPLLCKKYI